MRKSFSFDKDKMVLLKAALALLIVADHLTFHVETAWLFPFRKLGAPIVAVFLFISGYGLLKSYQKKGPSYLEGFFKKRIIKVMMPAFVALLVWYIVNWTMPNPIGELWSLVRYGMTTLPYSWYVVVITLFYLLFWLVYSIAAEKVRLPLLALLTAVVTGLFILIGYDRCWWVCNMAFPAGAFLAHYEKKIADCLNKGFVYSLSALFVCFAAFLVFYLSGNEFCYILCYPFIAFAVAIVVGCIGLPNPGKAIALLGSISYEIYLCQGIVMDFLRGTHVFIHSDMVYIVMVYAFVIVLAYIVNLISRQALKVIR